jgi:hypothetical protein
MPALSGVEDIDEGRVETYRTTFNLLDFREVTFDFLRGA